MKQGWLERSIDSIAGSIQRTASLFTKLETWAVLALLLVFGVLIFFAVDYALRTDTLLLFLGHRGAPCREPGDAGILGLFGGAFFFALATVAMFGEITQYLQLRRLAAPYETQRALKGALGWGGFAFLLGLTMLLYLRSLCL